MPGPTPRVLIVDDEPNMVGVLARLFRSTGWEVDARHCGDAALEAVAGCRPDVLLLDCRMPGLSGPEVCAALQARGERIPVLLMSGLPGLDRYATTPGVVALLRKPIDWPVLRRTAEEAVAGRLTAQRAGPPEDGTPPDQA